MSRYGGDPRYSTGNIPYRDAPPAPRWDADRFATERDRRVTETVIERDRTYEDYAPPPRRQPVFEEQRIYEEERFGPRGNRTERRYFEEEETFDPRASRGALIPFRPERPSRPEAPPRPGIIRRQSSLDTFDRRPSRRIPEFDDYRPPAPRIPVPRGPEPRRDPRYEEREYYEDVRIQDPDDFGGGGFREYKEREWISRRRRSGSHSRDRGEVVKEEVIEEIKEEKPFPRKGKTKMPKRLIHTKVLFDLGYPYYEENDTTIIIEKALGPANIDEVINLSKEYWEREEKVSTTRLIEAPPVLIREEKIFEEIKTVPISEAPPSVQNWDGLRSPSPKSRRSRSRRRSRSTRRSRSRSRETIEKEVIIERKITREVSPARTAKSGRSRRPSSPHGTEIIERRIIEQDGIDESNSVHLGPLALVVDRRKSRNERDIQEEIRALEAERRRLRRERDDRDVEVVKVERLRERSLSRPRAEIILADRDEVIEVRKDKRARSVAPSPGIIRAMMATLT